MMNNKYQQRGFSLFMVMIMMIVIALLVVITSQSTSTESRLSTNEADRKYALTEAELGLRAAETFLDDKYRDIVEITKKGAPKGIELVFTQNCSGTGANLGLCAPAETVTWMRDADKRHFNISNADNGKNATPAWERTNIFSATSSKTVPNGKARYIIEYLGQREESGNIHDYFRVTSRATGENANTLVTLQSYVEMTRAN